VGIHATADGVIALPLAPLLAALPPNLAALVASPGSGTFSLPVKTALAQLASGAVRISFGELRQGSPPGTFYDNASQDKALVNLPLPQILASLDPALLARRPGQKLVTVPENVTSVFGEGRALQPPVAAPAEPVHPPAPVSALKPLAPEPGASHFTQPPKPGPLPSLLPKAPAPAPPPHRPPAPVSLSKPDAPQPGASHFTQPPRAGPLPPLAPKAPAPTPPAAENEFLAIPLSALSESWPQPVQQAIAEFQLQSATVSVPLRRLEAGLKAGRVVFTWGELCQWLQPPPPEQSSAHREAALELPLKVVAPLFLARRTPGAAPKKLAGTANIPGSIPELFGRLPGAPKTAVSAPAATSSAAAAPGSAPGEMAGLPDKEAWAPAEICRGICALEGVAGSVLAMSDGLAVAAQLPPPLKADTVAAFLPQIFSRISQSAGEMQLGAVTGIVLMAGQGDCAIYKTGKLYLAVLGHPGATLPQAVLGRIAAELAKRNP
jgi:predicted regulator of Ras-like GTPase activity (Roadblock/LC7/MglB family)